MPSRAQLEQNLRTYPLFAAVVHTPFFVPIVVLFWEDNGLDMFDIFLLQGLFAVAMAVLEVPTGMVADRVGKRSTVLSMSSLGSRAFFALSAPIVGVAARELVIENTLRFQAILVAVILAAVFEAYRRTPAKYFRIKESVRTKQ
jgi:MFS family permease